MQTSSNQPRKSCELLPHPYSCLSSARAQANSQGRHIVSSGALGACVSSRADSVTAKLPETQRFGPFNLGKAQCFW